VVTSAPVYCGQKAGQAVARGRGNGCHRMAVAATELGRERSGVLRGEVLERWWRGAEFDRQQQVAAGQLRLPQGRRKVKKKEKNRKEEWVGWAKKIGLHKIKRRMGGL
jgi:hypothetical protein